MAVKHIKQENAIRHQNSSKCVVYEYPTSKADISLAMAEVAGRYPDRGYVLNRSCTEMAYVVKGQGFLVTETNRFELTAGDVAYIPSNEKFYWEGVLTLVLPTTPAFSGEQHEHILDTEEIIF